MRLQAYFLFAPIEGIIYPFQSSWTEREWNGKTVKRLHRKKKARSSFLRFYFGFDPWCQSNPDDSNVKTEPEPGNHLALVLMHSRGMRAWPEGLKKT